MPYVANLSLGTSYGPHDGRTLEEVAIDSLVGPGKPGKVIVVAAGNSGNPTGREYRHIQGRALTALESTHTLTVPKFTKPRPGPGNDRVLVDLWYEGGDQITISVTAPDGRTRVEAPYGRFIRESTPFGDVFIFNLGGTSPLNGDTEAVVLLHDESGTAPAAGVWTITLTGEAISGDGSYDGWLVEAVSEVGGKDQLGWKFAAQYPYVARDSAQRERALGIGHSGAVCDGRRRYRRACHSRHSGRPRFA